MGAGVQTVALLFGFHKEEKWDFVIFADTQEENIETYEYLEEYIKPFCIANNIKFVTVKDKEGLMEYCLRKKNVPNVRKRWCTDKFKIRPIQRYLKKVGGTKENPVICDIGITIDESHRIGTSQVKYTKNHYPLIDRNLSRKDCKKIITDLGYPLPRKSGCDLCMYNKRDHFKKLSLAHPERFAEIVKMEQNSKSYSKGYFLQGKYPLELLVGSQSLDDFTEKIEDSCNSEHCML
jgi:hypothetical protein